jgi:hypothetical protein
VSIGSLNSFRCILIEMHSLGLMFNATNSQYQQDELAGWIKAKFPATWDELVALGSKRNKGLEETRSFNVRIDLEA